MPIIQDPKKKFLNNTLLSSPNMFANSPTLSAQKPIGPQQTVAPSNPSATNTVKSNIATTSAPKTQLPPAAQPFINSLANTPSYNTQSGLLTDFGRSQGLKEVNAPQTATTASQATTAPGTASTAAPSAYDTARKAYLDSYKSYLDSLKTPTGTSTAEKNVEEFNQRASEEMLRNRQREDELRRNEIGQLERGQTYQLGEEERLSNRSIADLALAKGVSLESIKLAQEQRKAQQEAAKAGVDFSQSEVEFAQGEKPVEVGGSLVDPRTGKVVYSAPEKPEAKPTSVQEYEYAKQQGYTGTYQQYQNEDANRKAVASAVAGASGLTPAQTQNFLRISDKYQADAVIKNGEKAHSANLIANQVLANPQSAGNQLKILYTLVKNLDPDSAVREGELDLAQRTQSYFDKFSTNLQRIAEGKLLSNAATIELANATKDLANVWVQSAKLRDRKYNSQAQVAGLSNAWNQYQSGFQESPATDEIAELEAQGYSPEQIQQIINAQ